MRRFQATLLIAVILATSAVLIRGVSPAGAVAACGWTNVFNTYHAAYVQRYYPGNGTYGNMGFNIQAVENTCDQQGGRRYYYAVSTWKSSGFGGASIFFSATLKVRVWHCGAYQGTWTVNTSGWNGTFSVNSNIWWEDECAFQADDLSTSDYSNSLTPGPGQAAVSFGAYLHI